MRSYPCKVVGIPYEGRMNYITSKMRPGSEVDLVLEPKNSHDKNAVAAYHNGTKIGYIPADKAWVSKALLEGDEIVAEAVDVNYDDDGEPMFLAITVHILSDGNRSAQPKSPPPQALAKPPRVGFKMFVIGCFAVVTVLYGVAQMRLPSKAPSPPAPSQTSEQGLAESRARCQNIVQEKYVSAKVIQAMDYKGGKLKVFVTDAIWNSINFDEKTQIAETVDCGVAGEGRSIIGTQFISAKSGKILHVWNGAALEAQ